MDDGCYYGVGDMYYGSRMVFRYNRVTNAYWQNHATRKYERGGCLKAEIYNNDFNATDAAWFRAIHMRSGTGVIFNNTFRGAFNTIQVDNQRSNGQNTDFPFGPCDGSSSWDGNITGESGWPCLDQIGRGPGQYPSQPSEPLYIWNNGTSISCSTGGSCSNNVVMVGDGDTHVQENRNYINNGTTPKPDYTPYTYPHPLIEQTLAIDDIESNFDILIFPNPAKNNEITIKLPQTIKIDNIKIYDVSGKEVFTKKIDSSENEMTLKPSLSKGIYVVKITSAKGVISKKVIIE